MTEAYHYGSDLIRLQQSVARLLKTDPEWMRRTVISEDVQDIDNEVEKAMSAMTGNAGLAGTAAIVMTITGATGNSDTPGPFLDNVSVMVWVYEMVLLNRSSEGGRIPALALAERAMRFLHHQKPMEGAAVLLARELKLDEHPTYLAYRIEFKTRLALAPRQ